jgi:hypothetical protein
MKRRILHITAVLMLMTANMFSQDTVKVSGDVSPTEGNLNRIIKQVTDAGKLSNTVFKLELNGRYVLTDSILVPAGEHLTIVAPEPGKTQLTVPPQILWSSKSVVGFKYFISCSGNITIKNVWLYSAKTEGYQVNSYIVFQNDPLASSRTCEMENVILDYFPVSKGGSITVACRNFKGTFKNCYWKNCTDPLYRYFGRAVSFPNFSSGLHIDKIVFENCTFANIGYVYSQENGNYADEVKYNHCTFLNVVMHSLQSGSWYRMSVTNSIFVNTYMYGDIPAVTGKNDQNGGTIRIDSIKNFGFAVPYKEQERKILFSNNSYFLEKWLRDWMENGPYARYLKTFKQLDQVPQPQPMLSKGTLKFFEAVDATGTKAFPLMNKANLYDSTDPGLVLPPTNVDSIKGFLYKKWANSAAENWAYLPEQSLQRIWPLKENIAYTNDALLKAGMGSFPLGDLYRWFPEKYKQWKAQEGIENDRITTWLETGKDKYVSVRDNKDEIPTGFYLSQNYPNPFNPSTTINYSIPVETRHASSLQYVTLKVYDLLGREIATLIDEYKTPGNYEATFNASSLPSGVYFYILTTSQQVIITKKMILVK